MLFLCCHPAPSPASQVALTLRAVGGLTTAEIARLLRARTDHGGPDQPGQAADQGHRQRVPRLASRRHPCTAISPWHQPRNTPDNRGLPYPARIHGHDIALRRNYVARTELYDTIGAGYALGRRTDPRWMTAIRIALGAARSVLDVGAGTGSYEPEDRTVYAVEPSGEMIRQRPKGAAPVVRAVAEALPIRAAAADAVLAVLTVHHWTNWRQGLAELRRVAPRRVVLAYDTRLHAEFWLVHDYIPEIADLELSRPSADDIAHELDAHTVMPLLVPWDFTDAVFPAHWRRPAAYLDPRVRRTCSALAQTPHHAVERGIRHLREDLNTGRWHEQHRDLLTLDEWDAGFRLIVSSD
jgi:SAM-dependent methyltransferase